MKFDFFKRFIRKEREASLTAKAPAKGAVSLAGGQVAAEKIAATVKEPALFRATGDAYRALVAPLNTEKAAALASQGKYVFSVDTSVNKVTVKKAVEKVYGVKVRSVNLLNYGGKAVSYGRYRGQRRDWRKAIVTLAKGQRLDLYKSV